MREGVNGIFVTAGFGVLGLQTAYTDRFQCWHSMWRYRDAGEGRLWAVVGGNDFVVGNPWSNVAVADRGRDPSAYAAVRWTIVTGGRGQSKIAAGQCHRWRTPWSEQIGSRYEIWRHWGHWGLHRPDFLDIRSLTAFRRALKGAPAQGQPRLGGPRFMSLPGEWSFCRERQGVTLAWSLVPKPRNSGTSAGGGSRLRGAKGQDRGEG